MEEALKPETIAEIQRWINSGRYPDANGIVRAARRAQREQDEAQHSKVRDLVLAGLASGPGEELTDELWEENARFADVADRLGLPIRREVQR